MAVRRDASGKDLDTLAEVRLLTRMIREHQQQLLKLGQRRRTLVARLRGHGVTFREIAEYMETSEMAVYKLMSEGDSTAKRAGGRPRKRPPEDAPAE